MAQDRPRISKRYSAFVGNPDNYSGRINSIIGRYQHIVTDGMPELTEYEWLAICDANNGTVFPDPNESTKLYPACYAWVYVADSDPVLASKMKSMSFIEQCGVVEVVIRFWEKSDQKLDSYNDRLIAAGANIKK